MLIFLIISIIINVIFFLVSGFKIYEKYYLRPEQQKRLLRGEMPVHYSMDRATYLKTLPCDSNEIVFIGTSAIQNFELAEMFQNIKIT